MINEKSKEDFMDFMVNEIQKDSNIILKEVRPEGILTAPRKKILDGQILLPEVYFALIGSSEKSSEEYLTTVARNLLNGVWTVPIFDKDEHLIRPKKNRTEILERLGLKDCSNSLSRKLVELTPPINSTLLMQSPVSKIIIYQRETKNLEEGLRAYDFQQANPHSEKVKDSEIASRYMIAVERYTVPTDRLYLRVCNSNIKLFTLGTIPKGPKIKEEDYL